MTTSTETADGKDAGMSRRPHGQWAIDGTSPLNHNEEIKAADNGLNVRERIEQIYSVHGFSSISADDLSGRMRWWGLYTQRRPGIPGGRTAQLEPHELSDEYFMLRIRLDGGAVSCAQLRAIADISTDYARDTADISDRQNVQLHWIRIEDVPVIWQRLEAVGLQTTEACGDTPRVILASPVAGVAAEELIDPTPVVDDIVRRFIGDPELANLPRKFKSAITGHPSLDVVHEINDISLIAVDHPRWGVGYDLWVGGGLSTNPRLAQRLGAFVPPEEAAEVWHAVLQVFRDYGYRRLRQKARLKFLLADWGAEKFRTVLEQEYLGRTLADGPAPPPPVGPSDHIGVHPQKDGLRYVGAAPTVGRVSGSKLRAVADLMEAAGSDRLRFTPHQKLVLLDIPSAHVQEVTGGLERLDLRTEPSALRRAAMACTGIEYCKLAIVETKATASAAIDALETRLADLDLDQPLSVHVNGCPNSCARIQTADIGLKGQIITLGGEQVPGFQVHLGGGLASAASEEGELGRTVRGLKVSAEQLPDYVERVVRSWVDQRRGEESFAAWAHRAEAEALV